MSDTYPSSRVVQGAVILGLVTTLFSAFAVAKLISTREAETLRYQACAAGARQDCEPSLFWLLAGLVKSDGRGGVQTGLPSTNGGKRVVRSSEAAPLLTSLKPDGFTPQGTGYEVKVGAEVTLTATVENAKRVEALFHPAGITEDVMLGPLPVMAGKEGNYQLKLSWKETRSGELEIRSYGTPETEQAALFLPLRVSTVANEG